MFWVIIGVVVIAWLLYSKATAKGKQQQFPTQLQVTDGIRVLDVEDKDELKQLVDIWMCGNDNRLEKVTWMKENAFLKFSGPFNNTAIILSDSGKIVGASGWVPPGEAISDLKIISILDAPFRVGWGSTIRGLMINFAFHSAQVEIMKGKKFWYLHVLGVDPDTQKKGYGKKLMATVLPVADKQGVSCYLDTSNPRNVPYYEQFGFKVKKHIKVLPFTHSPPFWFMEREPQ